nr:AP-4 complex subunit sigma [Tanacetum cinerariifolium]
MPLGLKKYAFQLLERAHMVNCKPSRTPVDTDFKWGPDGVLVQDPTLYRSLAKGLQYLTFTRPDLSYAVITFLSWSAKRQHTISRSSDEAKYRGVANVVAETAWIRNLLRELHSPLLTATLVYCDNVSAVYSDHQTLVSDLEMGIRFILMVNKQGQTRLAQYYEYLTLEERRALEGEIVRKCLARNEQQCSFVEHRNYKIVYRRYASLFFLVGVDNEENELAILEFIHLLVETMDRHFGNVCELDIMFHLEKAHFMLEEMVMNGCIVETSKANILAPIQLMDKAS